MAEGQRDYEDTADGEEARVEASWARYTAESPGLAEGQQIYKTKLIITPPKGASIEYNGIIPISIEEGDLSNPKLRAEFLKIVASGIEAVAQIAEESDAQTIKEKDAQTNKENA